MFWQTKRYWCSRTFLCCMFWRQRKALKFLRSLNSIFSFRGMPHLPLYCCARVIWEKGFIKRCFLIYTSRSWSYTVTKWAGTTESAVLEVVKQLPTSKNTSLKHLRWSLTQRKTLGKVILWILERTTIFASKIRLQTRLLWLSVLRRWKRRS